MSITGRVLRIERSSSYDGEGLRTVVFMKGCPLSCLWCSAPESQSFAYEIGCESTKCKRCGLCIMSCPNNALYADEHNLPRSVAGRCKGCGKCRICCPTQALSLYGGNMSAEDVVKEIEKDAVFYFHSGGGFTLSGGEVLSQPDFAAEVFRLAAEEGIGGTIETSAWVPWKNFEAVLPWISKIFVDIKHMDPVRHKELTGQTNELILDNIRRLDRCGKHVTIRIPVIPSINDSDENIIATAKFCGELENIAGVELLAYHKLGMITYQRLGRSMALPHIAPPDAQTMRHLARLVKLTLPYLSVKINGGEFQG